MSPLSAEALKHAACMSVRPTTCAGGSALAARCATRALSASWRPCSIVASGPPGGTSGGAVRVRRRVRTCRGINRSSNVLPRRVAQGSVVQFGTTRRSRACVVRFGHGCSPGDAGREQDSTDRIIIPAMYLQPQASRCRTPATGRRIPCRTKLAAGVCSRACASLRQERIPQRNAK